MHSFLPVGALLLNALVWGVSWWPFRFLHARGLHPLWATALMYVLAVAVLLVLMIDTMKEMGPDSFVGRMSCVVRGASDTTFYILAVYFGSVGITKTRNAVTCGLIADFSGIIAAILISYLFFF